MQEREPGAEGGGEAQFIVDYDTIGDVTSGIFVPPVSEAKRKIGGWRFGAWPMEMEAPAPKLEGSVDLVALGGATPSGPSALPIFDRDWNLDERFQATAVSVDKDCRPRLPGRVRVLVVDAQIEDEQQPLAYAEGQPFVIQWRGRDQSEFSSWWWDIDDEGRLDYELGPAPSDTGWRITKPLARVIGDGDLTVTTGGGAKPRNGLAWNLTASPSGVLGFGASVGIVPTGLGIGYMGHELGGPLYVGAGKLDKHVLGEDEEGLPHIAGHIHTDAFFFKDVIKDAALEFRDEAWEEGALTDYPMQVHLRHDIDADLWRWQTWAFQGPPQQPGVPVFRGQGNDYVAVTGHNETSAPALSGKPSPSWEPRGDTRYALRLTGAQRATQDTAPTTWREDTFGARMGRQWGYTQRQGARYASGTGNGGRAFMPPERTIEDYRLDGTRDDSRPTSKALNVTAPGACGGFLAQYRAPQGDWVGGLTVGVDDQGNYTETAVDFDGTETIVRTIAPDGTVTAPVLCDLEWLAHVQGAMGRQ